MQTAYSYQRFSHQRQVNPHKLRQQLEIAREYAVHNGLALDEDLTFQDLGVSAFRGANREHGHLADFLMAVRHGFVESGSYLLVESLDRLSRETARKALRTLEDICDEGITVVTLIDNQKYTSELLDRDPASLLISLVIFLRANEESRTKSRRIRAAWARKIERVRQGEKIIISKMVPGWLKIEKNEIVVDPERVKAIRLIFRLGELGLGGSTIATVLNRNQIPTLRGHKHWYKDNVSLVLSNASVIGVFVPHTYERIDGQRVRTPMEPLKGYFPRIISQKTWQRTQGWIEKRQIRFHKKAPASRKVVGSIFARLAKCPRCGSTMGRRKKSLDESLSTPSRYYFLCTMGEHYGGCEYHTVQYQPIEDLFLLRGPEMMRKQVAEAEGDCTPSNPHERKLLAARIEDVIQNIEAPELDRFRLNRQLKNLFQRVTVNYLTGNLEFEWAYGGISILPYEKFSRAYMSAQYRD